MSDIIGVGIDTLPMLRMKREMSSGAPYHERDPLNVLSQRRGSPAVLPSTMGVAPVTERNKSRPECATPRGTTRQRVSEAVLRHIKPYEKLCR
ncbi:MAG: hypothetical protein F4Z29_09775 [Gemmatimonadetes bacterium]|nr:hypothetical protein [Gemmatimonadota bacterium]